MGNQNSGPRPAPHSLRMLRGTRKDRLNPSGPEPKGDVAQPDDLSVAASRIWAEIAPICLHMGTLTAADVPTFAKLCELEALHASAIAAKSADGFAMFSEERKVHPAIKLQLDTATALRPYYDYFGMTPMSRSKIQVPKADDKPASKWAGALR